MKILYVHHKNILELTANNIQVLNMCNAFSRLGHEVHLLIPKYIELEATVEGISNIVRLDEKIKISLYRQYKVKGIFLSTLLSLKILSLNNENHKLFKSFELIFTRHITSYLVFRKLAAQIIFEIHNNYFFKTKLINDFFIKELNKKKYNNKTVIICISHRLKEFWTEKLSIKKIIVSHDGFDEESFRTKIGKNEARKLLSLPLDKNIATYVGSMRPDREIENIIQIAKSCPEFLFLLIGGPDKYVDIHRSSVQSLEIENIKFIGIIPNSEVPKYLYSSDVLLALWSDKVPTINFCSPLKIFEYMASGTITIAHSYPTIKEVYKNGHNSILVAPNDNQEVIDALKQYITMDSTKKSNIRKNAINEAFSYYTWSNRVKTILNSLN